MYVGVALCIVLAPPAQATSVGNIQVSYNCATNFDTLGILDGPVFAINNTSGINITSGVFSYINTPGNSFNVGTIAANGQVLIKPGISNDGGSHASGAFFAHTGTIRDTSEVGPNADTTQFEFTGIQGPLAVDSGIFTPAATRGPSNDGNASVNFLGNNDIPCTMELDEPPQPAGR